MKFIKYSITAQLCKKIECKRIRDILIIVLVLIQGATAANADDYGEGATHTYTDDVTTCSLDSEYNTYFCVGTYQFGTVTPETTVIFDKNIDLNFSTLNLTIPDGMRQSVFTSAGGRGVLTVTGDMTVKGYGSAGSLLKQPQSLMSYGGTSLTPASSENAWLYATYTINGNLSLDGGILVDTAAPANWTGANLASNLTMLPHDTAGEFRVTGTTTMHVQPDRTMFYNNGNAAVLAPISIDDTHVIFNGPVDFDLPVLTAVDGNGLQSIYGAIVGTGTRANVSFNGGGTYTVAQKYQANINGVPLLYHVDSAANDPSTPNRTAIYGWVTLMGQSNLGGTRNGINGYGESGANGLKVANGPASFIANNMTLNYTMEQGGPPDKWGIVALQSNATATLKDTVLNLTMEGAQGSRTAVFLGGMQTAPYGVTALLAGYEVFTNVFNLDNVQVNFADGIDGNEVTGGKNVSLFYIDSSATTATVTNGSKLVALTQGNANWADRSLIYIDQTLDAPPAIVTVPVSLPIGTPKETKFNLQATDSTLGGGAYVAASDKGSTELTMLLDGNTTWTGDATVETAKSGKTTKADITVDGNAIWTGKVASTNATATVTVKGSGIWKPTANIAAASFVGGSVSLDGGTIQAQTANLGIDAKIALDANGGIIDTNSKAANISGIISGAGALTKSGDGVLTLTGVNTYQDGTVLKGGTVSVAVDTALGNTGTGLTFDGGTLQVTGTAYTSSDRGVTLNTGGGTYEIAAAGNNFTVSGNVTGTGGLTKIGVGTLTLGGTTLNYSGDTLISAGKLVITGDKTGAGKATISTGTTLQIGTGGANGTFTGDVANGDALSVKRTGAITLAGEISGAGTLTMDGGGTLTLSHDNSNYSGDITVTGNSRLAVDANKNLGAEGAQATKGSLTLNNGTLQIDADGFSADRLVHLTGNGTFDTNGHDATFTAIIDGTGKLIKAGAGVMSLTAANTYAGGTDITGGTLQITGTNGSVTGDVSISSGAILELARSNTASFANKISGAGAVIKTGVGTTTLSGTNDYQGGTTISGGTLAVHNDVNLGKDGALTFNDGTLQLLDAGFDIARAVHMAGAGTVDTNGKSGSFSGVVDGAGVLTKIGAGTLTLSGANTYTGGTVINSGTVAIHKDANLGTGGALTFTGGTLQLLDDGFAIARAVHMTGAGTIDTNGKSGKLTGVLDGAGGLTKTGAGTLTLTADNSGYSGAVVIDSGVLSVGVDNNLGTGALTIKGGSTLQLTDNFTTSRNVTLGAGTGTIETAANKTSTFSTAITGAGKLSVTGAGTLVLAATNNYSGGTDIANGGTLQIGNATADGSVIGNIANAGVLNFQNSNQTIFDQVISGTGALNQNGSGTLILTGTNTYTGDTTIANGSTLQVGNSSTSGSIAGDVIANGTLAFKRQGTLDFSGVISGAGTLEQNGTGTINLTGDSSAFTGTTHVTFGELQVNKALGGTMTVDAGATLSGAGIVGGKATVNGTLAGTSGNGLTFNKDLILGASSTVDVSFDQAGDEDGVFNVKGALTLGGTVNVVSFGADGPGLYHLFHAEGGYTGTIGKGTLPSGVDPNKVHINSTQPNDVYIANSNGAILTYWNGTQTSAIGDGNLYGGDGTWSADAVSLSWTDSPSYDVNGAWDMGQFAVFSGTQGTVTVDNTFGTITASGMQFITNGYKLKDGTLTLISAGNGAKPSIKVGSGSAADTNLTTTIATVLAGTDGVTKAAGGTLILTAANTYTGGTDITGGTLQLGDGTNNGSVTGAIDTGTAALKKGILAIQAAGSSTVDNLISGIGRVTILSGDVTLSGSNTYSGGTTLSGGTAIITQDNNLGAVQSAVNMNGGTLRFGADFDDSTAFTHAVTLTNTANVLDTNGHSVVISGAISGSQALTKSGTGTLILTSNNTYSGGTIISSGTVQVGNGGTSGSIVGDVANSGTLAFNRADSGGYAYNGLISGNGGVEQRGSTTLTLTNVQNTYKGGTTVKSGMLAAAADGVLGDVSSVLTLDGGGFQNTTAFSMGARGMVIGASGGTLQMDSDLTLQGKLTGAGTWTKTGSGALNFADDEGDFTGVGIVQTGKVKVDGTLGGSLTVKQGATLAGKGTIKGDATLDAGATLIGLDGNTLTFAGKLTLGTGTNVNVTLGTPTAQGLFKVQGDLNLGDSILNVTEDVGGFGAGIYRIFDYESGLTGTMKVGTVPNGLTASDMWIQDAYANQINLVNQSGVDVTFWNAEGDRSLNNQTNTIVGGSGKWDVSNDNWTEDNSPTSPQKDKLFNARWDNGKFAVFGGNAGTVTIDNQASTVKAAGLQFATSGYVVTGDDLTLDNGATGTAPIIRVGNGSADANMTATIAAKLQGQGGLRKTDYGTLVLTADNIYTGDTTVTNGVLQLGDGGLTGRVAGDITVSSDTYGDGALVFNRQNDVVFVGNISGAGKGGVTQRGTGTLTLSGDNSFSGGLVAESGIVKAGIAGHSFGTGTVKINTAAKLDLDGFDTTIGGLTSYDTTGASRDGNIDLGAGTLTIIQGVDSAYSGAISGTGGLIKNGSGTLTLKGANQYSGATTVNTGTLKQGAEGVFNTVSSAYNVSTDGTLDLGGYNTTLAVLSNAGTLYLNSNDNAVPATVLTIAGDYIGNGGTIVINTVLGDDNSKTDRIKIGQNTSGDTNIKILNRNGLGAQTTNGIQVISVGGQANGTFTLLGDYITKDGKKAVSGGAYAYTLQQGGASTSGDKGWYLTSQRKDGSPNPDTPEKPRYSASIPLYEGYARNMQALNKLPTLQERVGNRYWTGENGNGSHKGATIDARGIWARIEGAHNHFATQTASDMKQDVNTYLMQAGIDGQFYENEHGSLLAGLTGQYGHARGDVSAFDGDGQINTSVWSLGATATWYSNNGFYLDHQAQISWFDNDLYSETAKTALAAGRKATGYALSIEAGQRIDFDANWTLTPQAQLMWTRLHADTFQDAWGSRVSLHDSGSLTARLGIAVGNNREWIGRDGLMVNRSVYALANIYQQIMGNVETNIADVPFTVANDRTWAGIGAGGTYSWAANKYAIYGEGLINTSLHDFANSYAVKGTIGLRVRW